MTNLSRPSRRPLLNIPAPSSAEAESHYARFIPAEELGDFSVWQPKTLTAPTSSTFHPLLTQPVRSVTQQNIGPPAEVEQTIAAARQAAYDEGYREGMKGLEDFKRAHAQEVEGKFAIELAQWLHQLDAQWELLEPRLAEGMAQAAVRLARQVLRQELRTQPEHVVALAREAVQAMSSTARQMELRVHPDDLPLIQQGLGELLQARGTRVQGDATLARGGCRVNADIAAVDASLESRWAKAAGALGSRLPLNEDPLPSAT
jgi:flagellar assembly protein FliH